MLGLNCGSGQRKFDNSLGWVNIDINPKWEPDICQDWNDLSNIDTGTVDYVVSHHSLEHGGCGEERKFMLEANRVLKPGGSLLVFVPDMKALAQRWLLGQIDDYTYFVNVYGAFMGDEADRHKWGWSRKGMMDELADCMEWDRLGSFDWRPIPGADIAKDWWILGVEAVR